MAIHAKLSRCHQTIITPFLMVAALATMGQGEATAKPATSLQAQLLNANPSFSTRNTPTTYYFTVQVPETSHSLKTIKIQQILGVDTIAFRQDASQAFVGMSTQGTPIPLAAIGGSGDKNTLTVAFAEPIQPGSTITVAARPRRNPNTDGVYLFRVTGFRADPADQGQGLGVGRIHVHSD